MKGRYTGECACHATIARAYAGATAAERGEEMDEGKWIALQRFAAGILPRWKAKDWKGEREAKETVCKMIRLVQQLMHDMLRAWRERAAGGIAFQQQRRTKAGWLQLAITGWRTEARTSRAGKVQAADTINRWWKPNEGSEREGRPRQGGARASKGNK